MATIVWALLGLTAICGTSWSYPVGVTTLTTNQEIHVSDSSSSSSEEVISTLEAKLTVTSVVEEAKDLTNHEDAKPIEEENEERLAPEGGVESEGGESAFESVSSSSPPSSTEEVEEEEESNRDVSDS